MCDNNMTTETEIEILEFQNFNINKIVTPIKVSALQNLFNYDRDKMQYWVKGFSKGFSLGYVRPKNRQHTSKIIPLSVGSPTILWNIVMKEVSLGRYADPYRKPPFENFI